MSCCPNRFQFEKMWARLWEFIHLFICVNSSLTACRPSVCAGHLEQRQCSHLGTQLCELQESYLHFLVSAATVFEDRTEVWCEILLSAIPGQGAAAHPILGRGGQEPRTVFVLQNLGALRWVWAWSNPSAFILCFQVWQRVWFLGGFFGVFLVFFFTLAPGCSSSSSVTLVWGSRIGSVSKDFTAPLTRGSLVGEEAEGKGESKGKDNIFVWNLVGYFTVHHESCKNISSKSWTKNPSPHEPEGVLWTCMFLNALYRSFFINSFFWFIVFLFQSEHFICEFIGVDFLLI